MNCPACQGPIYIAEEERGCHVRCGNSFCDNQVMQEGVWGHDEGEAYECLVMEFEKEATCP